LRVADASARMLEILQGFLIALQAMQRPAHAVEHGTVIRRLLQRALDQLIPLAVVSGAIDERIAERIERHGIVRTTRDDIAQLGNRLIHLIARLELKDTRETKIDRIRVLLERGIQRREGAFRIALLGEQPRLHGDRLDPVLRTGRSELLQVLQPFFEPLLLGFDAGRTALRRDRELAARNAPIQLQRILPRLARLGDRAEIEQGFVYEAPGRYEIAEALRGRVPIAHLKIDVGERALDDDRGIRRSGERRELLLALFFSAGLNEHERVLETMRVLIVVLEHASSGFERLLRIAVHELRAR